MFNLHQTISQLVSISGVLDLSKSRFDWDKTAELFYTRLVEIKSTISVNLPNIAVGSFFILLDHMICYSKIEDLTKP